MAGISLMKNKLEAYKCYANEALHFKLVRHESDLEDDRTTFHPDMTHQLFGDQESIFGYKDLEIQLYYSAAKLTTYLHIKYFDKVSPKRFEGVSADDVIKILAKEMPPGYYTNLDNFVAALPKDANFKPFGDLLHSYTVYKDGKDRKFEIYKISIDCPGFRDYHERLQTFLLFFVDAASFIDVDDDKWSFYLVFEKYRDNGNRMYAIVGYMTVYNYYAYPEKVRPRVSQVLIMPPFQRQGHGAQLLQTFYNECYKRNDILDITVEDPSENFQRLRDFVDAKNCSKLESFQPRHLHNGFSDEMMKEAQEKLKLSRKQARRVYEILRFKVTDPSNIKQYRKYRLDIKKRLNLPFQKNGRDFQKLQRALHPDELNATLSCMSIEQRHCYLEKAFEEHVEMCRHVIERLAESVD
ncbi:hypothetical protein CHS0354_016563 [Potamilus streckersoni]|uniref:Histone acetyltransferase type B catalytic subunit n=1 Tax=Potamilus streckersoni TaxID=2493646 RepID=A0AAE0TKV3_9BIVA|nr:hypothetical protein CHS0354_016563 [Potamilus streckersoni]